MCSVSALAAVLLFGAMLAQTGGQSTYFRCSVFPHRPHMADSKRPNVVNFGKRSYVSQSGLADLMRQIEREGLPRFYSPSTQARERARLAAQGTSFGPFGVRVENSRLERRSLRSTSSWLAGSGEQAFVSIQVSHPGDVG